MCPTGYVKPFSPNVPHIHLPKAGHIRQFPYHLRKVSTSIFTTMAEKCGNRCRCGRVRRGNTVQKVSRKGAAENDVPQRQRNAGIGAVVEGGREGNAVQKVYRRVQRKITYRNGSESREMLPLWKRAGEAMPSRRSVERVQRKITYRNGSESRESVPLWKGTGKATPSRRSVERVRRKMMYRNGRKMRESVPLWKEAGDTTPPEGLQQGFGGKSYSAAAEKCGICYRCGRGKGVTSPTRN